MQNKDTDLNLFLHTERLQLLYQQSYPAIFISFVTAILICSAFWSSQTHSTLLIWLAIVIAAGALRLSLFIRYRKTAPEGVDLLKWEKPYFITHCIAVVIWAVGAIWIMPKNSQAEQIAMYFFMMAMAGGGLSVYSAHRAVALTAAIGILLPITLWFAVYGDSVLTTCMVIGSIIFIISATRMMASISATREHNSRLTHQLEKSNRAVKKLANRDPLTGLFNRRAFYEKAKQYGNTEFSLILLDIDQFKQINDTFGHAAGDQVLKHLSHLTQQTIRKTDVFARLGGDEFCILLPEPMQFYAIKLAENLRKSIVDSPLHFQNNEILFTISLGIASGKENFSAVLHRADIAMYRAKESGRDSVVSDNIIGS